ncbi:class I SAM-dependent methyltransferase [Gilvimarinus sp. DA14]|uniref:class I SAM-dependent methyltransferase n=1 Tax=Gilvimarinus sp. DA14 TaxID=2956798 RepID=UPI0020B785A8|nr:class I SAM-dependent methyltransferase [Gilvimarinus sp. DA14]UTF61137.1 class I SAM-dependent methyltransferase [Gilvimarinus sp. DA14]
MTHTCPLCSSRRSCEYFSEPRRSYWKCLCCQLVFVPPHFYLSAQAEKAEYDLHQNSPDDPGYRKFLSRAVNPLQQRLAPGATGLDFGSGPEPVLQIMLHELGFSVAIYDLFYAANTSVWEQTYDFIIATEVVEHLHAPGDELQRLWHCLRPGGLLLLMTKRVIDVNAFSRWHYKNDPTHVCFFSEATFNWLADHWQAELTLVDKDVVILQKPGESSVSMK